MFANQLPTSPHSTRRTTITTPSCLLLPSSQEDPGRSKVEEKTEDRIQGYFIFLITAAETTIEGDEILVLGTIQ